MTTLRSYNHDFARLAKQSGYFFQLHRGKVNWTELENLNIEEIVENRNFELLEQNLLNVINCNLEREYDFKVLDQNFVKLFKLAQLGVDYLSYCQLYLDRCVILLQEQLSACQEKCEILQRENLKKNEELQEAKSKSKARNYQFQCEKCEKVFISEVYLKCHDKRRHSDLSTPKVLKANNYSDKCQQTDDEKRCISKSIQTLPNDNDTKETDEINKLKQENNLKIENMEKELEELKSRLKKAENTLIENKEISSTNSQHNLNFQSPIFYPPMLPFIPTYLPQPYFEVSSGLQMPVPDCRQPPSLNIPESVNNETVLSNNLSSSSHVNIERESDFGVTTERSVSNEIKVCEAVIEKPIKDKNKTTKIHKAFVEDKENIDPNKNIDNTSIVKPRPLPRKIKNMFDTPETSVYNKTIEEPIDVIDSNTYLESDVVQFSSETIPRSSTPKIGQLELESNVLEISKEGFMSETDSNFNESSVNQKIPKNYKSKSFIKKIVSRNSPKLQELSKNFKRSLTNLYDSVSASGKEIGKVKEVTTNSKETPMNALNNQLRELGIDPEWSGIPKKTMKEKLKTLKFQRKLLTKEEPMYPTIRKKLEENILRKLNKNFINMKMKGIPTTNERESIETQSSEALKLFDVDNDSLKKEKKSEVKLEKPIMYNIDTSSDSAVSDDEVTQKPVQITEKVTVEKDYIDLEDIEAETTEVKEDFDFSVFQANKEDNSKTFEQKKTSSIEVDDFDTDSDFDEEFLKRIESSSLKTVTGYFSPSKKVEDNVSEDLEEIINNQINFVEAERDKTGSQSILKSSQKIQSQPPMTAKKKVLFTDYPETSETRKGHQSEIKKKEENWLSDSDWDEDMS